MTSRRNWRSRESRGINPDQALSALLFLYRHGLKQLLDWLNDIERAKKTVKAESNRPEACADTQPVNCSRSTSALVVEQEANQKHLDIHGASILNTPCFFEPNSLFSAIIHRHCS
jgi:hypothetical protein